MNTKLPFEEAIERQLNDLPAPHEDASWNKMKQLLDANKRRVAPPFYSNYKFWGLLALLLLTAGLWFVVTSKKAGSNAVTVPAESKSNDVMRTPQSGPSSTTSSPAAGGAKVSEQLADGAKSYKQNNNTPVATSKSTADNPTKSNESKQTVADKEPSLSGKIKTVVTMVGKADETMIAKSKAGKIYARHFFTRNKNRIISTTDLRIVNTKIASAKDEPAKRNGAETEVLKNSIVSSFDETSAKQDETFLQKKDTIVKLKTAAVKDEPTTPNPKHLSTKLKKYFVTAGIGLQQPIPVGGQKVVAYGYNGKSAISDYIPSIYVTFERDGKWFVQAAFNYGAPRLVKNFAYSRETQFDNSSRILTTTTFNLKKTFYSEIPVSFNYYLRSNWSFGVGGMYSWFHGAIAEREVNLKNVETQQQTISKNIEPIRGFTDSFLYKSHTYLLLQTAYQLNRFSFGLRYTRDLQPYIKYTLPDGMIADKKNWSLEFVLRFRLWKSGMF